MALIKTVEAGLYRIPLTVTLSDSTHGEIAAFELVTCRVRDSDGAEGTGYTYTVGRDGGAIADILRREIPELIEGRQADDTEAIWHHVWWGLHYGGRGGPPVLALSALDIALWDLKARRANLPLFGLLGGFDARVPCYAGGIDLDLSVEALLKQTDDNLAKGFRAIKKVARLAEAFNLPVTSHGAHDVTVHLLAACPNRSYLEAHGFGLDRYIEHPLMLDQGMALAPTRPGHGITFDWKGLAQLAQ